MKSFAESRNLHFSFKESEALYRDHNGERVLADVEDSGRFSISNLPKETTLFIDGHASSLDIESFQEHLIITSKELGSSEVSVMCGDPPSVLRPPVIGEKFDLPGWIIDAKQVFSVDGETNCPGASIYQYPVPIKYSVTGKNIQFAPNGLRTVALSRLDMDESETLRGANWQVKNASHLFKLKSVLPDEESLDRRVLSHLNRSSFVVKKPRNCYGILIRKLYDAFHGRQRARVLVNGSFRRWWYEPIEDRVHRWRYGQLGLTVEGEEQDLEISIDPTAGSPLWSVAEYQVFGLISPALEGTLNG